MAKSSHARKRGKAKIQAFIEEQVFPHLDAYGHLEYTASFGNEWDEDWEDHGDLLLAADFFAFNTSDLDQGGDQLGGDLYAGFPKVMVAYHVVVNSESGGFIETTDQAIVPASKAPFDLVLALGDMGGDIPMTEDEWKAIEAANKRWNRDLAIGIKIASS